MERKISRKERVALLKEIIENGKCSRENYFKVRNLSENIDNKIIYIRKVKVNPFGKGSLEKININEGEVIYLRKNRVFALSKKLGLFKILGVNTKSIVSGLYEKDDISSIIFNDTIIIEVYDDSELKN
jgi:hypothetical protein